ncbi:MAG: Mut7-C RNAse domain-containing protein [Candidatus Marsarchaeota archaeon]|nr:Mut7-C RNAse domain-containing protein [Candidatus Marsarchaeota archaeon]
MLGQNTIHAGDYTEDDDEIIKLSIKNNAVLLTRDEKLYQKAVQYAKAILIKSDYLEEQLKQLNIKPKESRCTQCNGKLMKTEKQKIKNKIPKKVFQKINRFWKCEECGKIYWRGGHWKKIKSIKKILKIKS